MKGQPTPAPNLIHSQTDFKRISRMKLLTILFCLCALVCASAAPALSQKSNVKPRKAVSAICAIDAVPKNMVVVGYKANALCKAGKELIVKSAENGDIVCVGSPLPVGFAVFAEAQGPMIGSCVDKAFLIGDEKTPARVSELSPAALEAKCQTEVDKEIDRAIKNNTSEALTVWLAEATKTICMKSGGREH